MARLRAEGPTGFAEILDPEATPWAHDTVRCNHCGAIVFTVPGTCSMTYLVYHPSIQQWRAEAGAFCRLCMAPVCLKCHRINTGICVPLEAQLVASERTDEQRRRLWST